MRTQITPGRYRGLKACSLTQRDVFGIIAFDQRGSFRRMLPDGTPYPDLVQIKMEIIGALSERASAILTDPFYGLEPAMHMSGRSGLLMALEKSGYSGDSTYRRVEFLDGWTVEKVRKMGANAAKILVYYNPQITDLADELDHLIAHIVEDCHTWDLPVFVEPMSYSGDSNLSKDSPEFSKQRPDIVVETARRLSQTGADVLKMEFPVDGKYNSDREAWRASCAELSSASDVPWVLLSAGVDFEDFLPQVEIACASGASGFLAGRAIWKEGAAMSSAERKHFLENVALDRLNKLIRIATAEARSWTDFYSPIATAPDWFQRYS